MILTDILRKAIKHVNFYSISGNLVSESDPSYLDYKLRYKDLTNTAQMEIATTSKKIRKQHKVSQNPIPNQIQSLYPFDIQQHLDEDIMFSATGSRAYSFKVDNVADVYIEQSADDGVTWTNITTINHLTPTGQYTEYKGLISLSASTNLCRLRFGGNYVYNFRDVALFAYGFPNAAVIPQYQDYVLYTMPSTFYKLDKVTLKGNTIDGNRYRQSVDYYWESSNVLAVNYYFTGEFNIEYFAYPVVINDNTADNHELEIDVEAQEAIPYYVAAHLIMDENGNINNKLFAMYQGKLGNLDDTVKDGNTSVKNTLFQSDSSNLKWQG